MDVEGPGLRAMRSALRNWDERAGVRADPRRLLGGPHELNGNFFPKHLVAHLGHPVVEAAHVDVRRFLEAQHLYQFLRFTANFETRVVNRAAEWIANGSAGVHLPPALSAEAFKIYVDEGYHALYSIDVQRQIEAASGIPAVDFEFERFLTHLDGVGVAEFPQHTKLLQLLQVVVFETLVTSVLTQVPEDPDLIPLVRETVRDHAEDEVRHHAYFAGFFEHLWATLDHGTRTEVARFLPELIVSSLRPSKAPAARALASAGFAPAVVADIVEDSYGAEAAVAEIRRSASKTIGLLRRAGVLELPTVHERFVASGLIED
ncbi:diiron oxygenase [Allokutzneria sp. A3M-2-11 16]|uniref:diiron oxygenase n=1 Tax=Allokutzneria sp. A3M-2-11 16 TaxID=2962043 RepID=UPI0020B6B7CD|nr:diiron oxygenase [Allokutzneria sp. A3M-2-11 16]MCP3803366.1 diiron oxygenase [Allokutzneria sp. A3M-2-11 16]